MKKVIVFFSIILLVLTQAKLLGKEMGKLEKVKNIIIFIGDGMGNAQVASASYKYLGKNGRLEIEKFPFVGLVKTHAADKLITDSAAGATALATGYKTNNKMVGVLPDSTRLTNIFEVAQNKGINTGIVATSHITDATPSCFVAHVPERAMQDEIAEEMVNSKLKIILGGGKSKFIPQSQTGSDREDEKNLISEAIDNGFTYADSKDKLINSKGDKILGLFAKGGLEFTNNEPTLAEMTKKALEILSNKEEGFMLMVEGSQIDWRGHGNDFEGVIQQVKFFDDAVKIGKEFAENNGETLVIVTADHETGGLTLDGNSTSDESKLGINWSTGGHTAIPVPIYSYGPNAKFFSGVMDNTDIPKIISKIFNLNMDFAPKPEKKIKELAE